MTRERGGGNDHDGKEREADGGGGDLVRRARAAARVGRRDRRAIDLRPTREAARRGGSDPQAQGVLRGRARQPRRGASRLRPLHVEAGAKGPAAKGAAPGAGRGRGEVGARGHPRNRGARAGEPLLGDAIAWSWWRTCASSRSSDRTRPAGKRPSNRSVWPRATRSSHGGSRDRGSSPARPGPAWANTSPAPCRIGPRSPSRRILPGCSPPMPATGLRASRRPATRHRSGRCGRRSKKRSGSASRARRVRASSTRPWCRPSSTASSPRGCCGRASRRRRPAASTGVLRSGISAPPSCGRCSSSSPTPAACNRSASSRCWTGRRPPSTGWTGPPSSPASAKARRCPTSTSRSSKPSTPRSASSSASGTPRSRWSATWSPAWTRR